jgi:Uma2 family endonuclease
MHAFPANWTLADLQSHLGDVPADRIRVSPPPGYATEHDLVRLQESKEALCELVDGVLVEKTMGAYESRLAMIVGHLIETYLDSRNVGFTLGESGPVRTVRPQVRMPDVSYASWDKVPNGEFPDEAVLPVAPDLVVEVLSKSNTRREMARKLEEYFQAGTRLVWYIDPQTKSAEAFTAVDQRATIGEDDFLDGRDVLPGLRIRLGDVFERARRRRA